jgi:hypothetical protein
MKTSIKSAAVNVMETTTFVASRVLMLAGVHVLGVWLHCWH